MQKLNSAQLEAVQHGEGPLLVVAGAGSGKTTVITERFRFLIRQGVDPSKLLALTFTDRAAREMKQRVQAALPETRELLHISTFHAFCYQLLKTRHFDRKLLDRVDHWIFLRQVNMKELSKNEQIMVCLQEVIKLELNLLPKRI